ncbi:disulfide bond formation protein B [Altererythrobacter sp. C41]|uniref:disulfide bond formation protein B n=1 Tax=Altererythrobacter sp. C41 TaxID=2806021 RepID=UPI001931C582|nr:disulfide bond formation protein B [Altererythrobacter sp. C41]MBM0171303.1 disulfide bond formation protein B [Altererythrobacter sp. C41]
MLETPHGRLAQRLALGVPALLLAGAYVSQYGFGLYPCEMCWWQRWPHFAALALALLSTVAAPRRLWVALAALAILVSGAIGAFHAGVEYGWWEGVTACAVISQAGTGDPLEAIMNAPMVRCDQAPWALAGISLAGWNFLFSAAGGLAILWLLGKERHAP